MRVVPALLLAGLAATTSAQQLLDQPLAAGSTRSTVDLAVQAMSESRLALQFELRPAVQRAWLSPPDGRARELLPERDLQRVPAAQRPRPERGDLLVLRQPPTDPAPGRWQLVLEHAVAQRGDRLLGLVSQWPRFQLNLAWLGGEGPLRTGGEGLLDLRASDHGLPVAAASLQVTALHAASGQRQSLRAWSPRFEPAPLPLQPETGQTLVPFAPEQPGRYTLQAQWTATGRDGPVTLTREHTLDVLPQPLLQQVQLQAPLSAAGCVQRLALAVDWHAAAPGAYTLTVVLAGNGRQHTARGSQAVAVPGPLQLRADVPAATWQALGADVQVARLDLLHLTDTGFSLLQRRRAVPLAGPRPAAPPCP